MIQRKEGLNPPTAHGVRLVRPIDPDTLRAHEYLDEEVREAARVGVGQRRGWARAFARPPTG